jgi:hypothetical protein
MRLNLFFASSHGDTSLEYPKKAAIPYPIFKNMFARFLSPSLDYAVVLTNAAQNVVCEPYINLVVLDGF